MMNEMKNEGGALEALRQELDSIDTGLLKLLGERFVLTEQVKALKQVAARVSQSPLRPAREALILRRLLQEAKEKDLDPAFVLRLWRGILSESIRLQAPITIHIPQKLSATIGNRLRIRDHFANLPVEEWKDEAQAMAQVGASSGDLCIVETESNWVEAMIAGKAGGAQVVQTLPAISDSAVPKLLVIGRAMTEATGQDETLIVTQGNLPRDFALMPIWQAKVGPFRLSTLAGFFSEHEGPLVGIMRSNSNLGLMVAGRYPSPIEI
jgi:chorismate mutase / prephenate dehydratase